MSNIRRPLWILVMCFDPGAGSTRRSTTNNRYRQKGENMPSYFLQPQIEIISAFSFILILHHLVV
jgi:hypothetical protein